MPPIPFADNFLAGSYLTLLMPVCLLIVVAVWLLLMLRRVPEDTPESSSALPSPDVVAAAPDSEIMPAGPPPGDY